MKRLILAATLAAIMGCGIAPLAVYRVSLTPTAKADTCYVNPPNPNFSDTRTGLQADMGSWEFYQGPDASDGARFYLTGVAVNMRNGKANNATLEGTYKNGSYTFEVVDVEITKSGNPVTTITHRIATTITFKLNGDALDGTFREALTATCDGPNCVDFKKSQDNLDCDTSYPIKGAKIETQNYHGV